METGGRSCGLDTPEVADDQCSFHCGAPYMEFLEQCQGLLDQFGAGNLPRVELIPPTPQAAPTVRFKEALTVLRPRRVLRQRHDALV